MHIEAFTAYAVRLPLRRRIAHASAVRHETENLLICCRLANGTEGWGEGIPRPYVTGETVQGALRQLARTPLAEQLGADCGSWDEVFDVCQSFCPPGSRDDDRNCSSNSLRCAVELSILDAFGRLFGEPLTAAASRFRPAQPVLDSRPRVRYSGAITAGTPREELASALKMRCYGFADCKLKVGVDGADEPHRVRRIRRALGPGVDLRLDANEAWRATEVIGHIEPLLEHDISCIEQPVPHGEIEQLAEIRQRLPVAIMLDESLTSLADAETAIRLQACDYFNIRLSKCGGFLNCLRLAALAHEAGIGYQLGCHPGESGILSAAGRHWATSVGQIRYLEGSYDRHVLALLMTKEDITFGYGGWAPVLEQPGLGVHIDPAAVAKTKFSETVYEVRGQVSAV